MLQSITSRLNKWMKNDEHILVRCCERCMSLLLALLGLTRDCIGPSVISILSLHWPWAPSLPNQWNPVQKCLAWGVCLLFAIGRCLKFVTCALCNCVMGLVWTQDIQCMRDVGDFGGQCIQDHWYNMHWAPSKKNKEGTLYISLYLYMCLINVYIL